MPQIQLPKLPEKIKQHPLAKKARHILYTTPIEIAIGAITFGTMAFIGSYKYERDESKNIPLAFSEIEKTTKLCQRENQEVPALTGYYSLVNDVTMKVFEAKNLSQGNWMGDTKSFATQLEYKIEPTYKVHKLIPECSEETPKACAKAVHSLDKFVSSQKDLSKVISALDKAWDEDHDDHYHTQVYTTTSCNGKGQCHTTVHTRQVYDYTDHTYTYHKEYGAAAARLLIDFMAKHPEVNLTEKLMLAKSTEADNEDAIYHSMIKKFKDKMPTQEEYLEMANTWATGSNLAKYAGAIYQHHSTIKSQTPVWDQAKENAHSVKYRTYSRSDSGPEEFQISENILDHGVGMHEKIGHILGGIQYAYDNIPLLSEKSKEFVDYALNYKKLEGDTTLDEKADEVLKLAQTIYQKNFENGFDVDPFKWGHVLLWTFIGLGVGAGVGAAADRYNNIQENKRREEEWRKQQDEYWKKRSQADHYRF